MTDNKIREWLRNWNTDDFLREQRQGGRSNLPGSTIARYAAEHDRVTELLEERRVSAQDVPLARMLEAITAPLAALRADPVPRYYSYTGVNVLDEYVDGSRLDLEAQKALCVEGIRGLMLDLTHFEAYSLTGIEPWSTQKLDPEVISRRLQLLKRQFHAVRNLGRLLNLEASPVRESVPRTYATLEGYCNEAHPLSAIVQFTCIPSSCSHDEILFLRTIAEDELCFKAIYLAIRQAGEAMERDLFAAAACLLDQAVAFASMLHESFRVLQSMPPEHFLDFREVTGQASAVQSFNYQRLDIALFGLNPQKISMFQRVPHLRSLLQYSSREFASLRALIGSLPQHTEAANRIIELARLLDRHLLSWRGLHLSFALRYLPPDAMGTGGTAGPSYLQRFFRQSLFDDTEPDFTLIDEIFGGSGRIQEIFRARSGTRIAPTEDLWVGQAVGN
jgi:tryptophan 2,3-dioxygenase